MKTSVRMGEKKTGETRRGNEGRALKKGRGKSDRTVNNGLAYEMMKGKHGGKGWEREMKAQDG